VVRNACGESADCGNAACADGEVCEQNQCLCLAGERACELPEVLCGSSVCPVVDDTICCDDWTDSGWGTPSCSPRSECDDLTPGFIGPPQQWDLASACDGKDDCDEGQFCCFSGQGQPGAGAGRACMTESQCNTGSTDEAELGLGLYSCVSEADCPDSGQTCAAEVTGSETTSASQGGPFGVDNIPGRPHVKVCTPE